MLQFQWAAHQSANQRFADVVLRNYSAGDVVWVQDYHLMLLPAMLKNRAPKMKVGCGNLLRHLCILRCVAAPDQEREQLNLQCLDSTCVGPGLPPHAPPSQAQVQSTKDEGGQLGIIFCVGLVVRRDWEQVVSRAAQECRYKEGFGSYRQLLLSCPCCF